MIFDVVDREGVALRIHCERHMEIDFVDDDLIVHDFFGVEDRIGGKRTDRRLVAPLSVVEVPA